MLTLLVLLACSTEPDPSPDLSGPTTDRSAARAAIDKTKVATDLASLRKAIGLYKADHEGEPPSSLDDLGVSGLHYADAYVYDAETGTVTCPELPKL